VSRLRKVPAAAAAGFPPFICVSEAVEGPWTCASECGGEDSDDGWCEECAREISMVGGKGSWAASGATAFEGSPGVLGVYIAAGGYVGSDEGDAEDTEGRNPRSGTWPAPCCTYRSTGTIRLAS
jgi:hypothetical protein